MDSGKKQDRRDTAILLVLGVCLLALAGLVLLWASTGPSGEPLAELLRTKMEFENGIRRYPGRVLADLAAKWLLGAGICLFLGAWLTAKGKYSRRP